MVWRIDRLMILSVVATWLLSVNTLIRASEDSPAPARPSSPLQVLILSGVRQQRPDATTPMVQGFLAGKACHGRARASSSSGIESASKSPDTVG
jgi:hypothetical protein